MYFGPPTNLTLNGRSYFLVNGTLRTALAILAVWRNWSNSTKHLELAQKHFHWNEIPCLTKRRKLFPLFHIQWVGTFMEFYEHFTLDQNSLSYSFQKVEGSAYIHRMIELYGISKKILGNSVHEIRGLLYFDFCPSISLCKKNSSLPARKPNTSDMKGICSFSVYIRLFDWVIVPFVPSS